MNVIRSMICSLGTFASIISLAFTSQLNWGIRILIGVGGVICLCVLVYYDYKCAQINERICHTPEEIEEAMKELVKTQGKVCVVSRDLSWVTPEISACILQKKRDILIFVQRANDITSSLVKNGVKIKSYGTNFEPKTRFTVVRYNRPNLQVAIANTLNTVRKKKNFTHTIYQTVGNNCYQDAWINSLAFDMITLLDSVSEEIEYEEGNT